MNQFPERYFKDLVAEALREEVPELFAQSLTEVLPEVLRRSKLPTYLSRKQLSRLTGWSLRKVDYMRAERRIPFIRRGRTVLFPTAGVEEHLREAYVPAKSESSTTGNSAGLNGRRVAEDE